MHCSSLFPVRPNHLLSITLHCSSQFLRCSFYTSVLEIPLRFGYDIFLPYSPLRQQYHMLHHISAPRSTKHLGECLTFVLSMLEPRDSLVEADFLTTGADNAKRLSWIISSPILLCQGHANLSTTSKV